MSTKKINHDSECDGVGPYISFWQIRPYYEGSEILTRITFCAYCGRRIEEPFDEVEDR